jgi:hypothetical protein
MTLYVCMCVHMLKADGAWLKSAIPRSSKCSSWGGRALISTNSTLVYSHLLVLTANPVFSVIHKYISMSENQKHQKLRLSEDRKTMSIFEWFGEPKLWSGPPWEVGLLYLSLGMRLRISILKLFRFGQRKPSTGPPPTLEDELCQDCCWMANLRGLCFSW